ncbi:hypothetical protein WKI65_44075 [Streptomyces sp. MS1.AVA.3]
MTVRLEPVPHTPVGSGGTRRETIDDAAAVLIDHYRDAFNSVRVWDM